MKTVWILMHGERGTGGTIENVCKTEKLGHTAAMIWRQAIFDKWGWDFKLVMNLPFCKWEHEGDWLELKEYKVEK